MQSPRVKPSISLCPCVLVSLSCVLCGCRKEADIGWLEVGDAHRQAIAASNKLAFQVYAHVRGTPGNLVVSPYGVTSSLSMLSAGAGGSTRDELLSLLGTSDELEPDYHQAQGELMRWLASGRGASKDHDLRLGLGVFMQKGEKLATPFVKIVRDHYAAEPEAVDFVKQPATARKVINDWAAVKTQGKITDAISPDDIDELTRMVLASSVYFKGAWQEAFQRSETQTSAFHVTAEKTVDVDMMHQKAEFGYVHREGVRLLVMPYRGGQLSMVVILPDDLDGLGAVEGRADDETLTKWIDAASHGKVELPVWLPRFRFADRHDVKPALEKAGIQTAFDPHEADFSRMIEPESSDSANDPLFVDSVRQQALIEVNEEGTEAAAVTNTETVESKGPPHPPHFNADHPFLFLIRENETGLILFLGRVLDPSQE